MTTMPIDPQTQAHAAVIIPDTDTRLAQLVAQYDLAKAEADKAAETLKAITDAIKTELVQAAPGEHDIRLESDDLARPLRLLAIESWRVDAKRLKEESPETYVRFAKKSTSWQLRSVAS